MGRLRPALILLALVLGAGIVRAEYPKIDYVAWYYKDAHVFKRISEYFGGGERTARKVILRTDASERAGLYFVCRLNGGDVSAFPAKSAFVLELVTPDSPREKTYTFTLPNPAPDYQEIWLGLTGKDVPPGEEEPVAWRIQIKGPDGAVLNTYQSFLWSAKEPAS